MVGDIKSGGAAHILQAVYNLAGKPFRFWRTYSATATHGDRNRFDRCVWSHKYDGIEGPTKGKPYYNLELKFLTEGDDR